MKSDGFPTYHFANVVDDHLMEITHVLRGVVSFGGSFHHSMSFIFFMFNQSLTLGVADLDTKTSDDVRCFWMEAAPVCTSASPAEQVVIVNDDENDDGDDDDGGGGDGGGGDDDDDDDDDFVGCG